jgi:hypothetical protein
MATTIVPVVLPTKVYAELERQARAQERHPVRQAQWIIRQALQENSSPLHPNDRLTATDSREPEAVAR